MNTLELKVPPVVVFFVAAFCMKSLAMASHYLIVPLPWHDLLASILVAAGVVVALAGVVAFRRAATTLHPVRLDKASTVVTGGVYRLSRNPMYLGLLLLLLGWAAWLSNLLAWAGPVVFVLWMNRFQIGPEESFLKQKFGAEYEAYLKQTRRWL